MTDQCCFPEKNGHRRKDKDMVIRQNRVMRLAVSLMVKGESS
jgi:hypothetical protein